MVYAANYSKQKWGSELTTNATPRLEYQLLDFFRPKCSLSTTSSVQATRCRLFGFGPPRSFRTPAALFDGDGSDVDGWASRTVIVREPSPGAEVDGRIRVCVSIISELVWRRLRAKLGQLCVMGANADELVQPLRKRKVDCGDSHSSFTLASSIHCTARNAGTV
jgi:hypothetical protein